MCFWFLSLIWVGLDMNIGLSCMVWFDLICYFCHSFAIEIGPSISIELRQEEGYYFSFIVD